MNGKSVREREKRVLCVGSQAGYECCSRLQFQGLLHSLHILVIVCILIGSYCRTIAARHMLVPSYAQNFVLQGCYWVQC